VGIRTGIGASAPFEVGIFGGPAFGNTTVTTDIDQSRTQGGWSAGVGLYTVPALTGNVQVGVEGRFYDLGKSTLPLGSVIAEGSSRSI
jgi:hypothetical protein